MANYLTTDTELTSIANAIRTKGGTSGTLSYPTGFINAINNISTGSNVNITINYSDVVLFDLFNYIIPEEATVTDNGTGTSITISTPSNSLIVGWYFLANGPLPPVGLTCSGTNVNTEVIKAQMGSSNKGTCLIYAVYVGDQNGTVSITNTSSQSL